MALFSFRRLAPTLFSCPLSSSSSFSPLFLKTLPPTSQFALSHGTKACSTRAERRGDAHDFVEGESRLEKRVEGLMDGLLNGNRVSLAKAITLVESSREKDRSQCEVLLTHLIQKDPIDSWKPSKIFDPEEKGGVKYIEKDSKPTRALRVGISGPPGVGKSSFIEIFGLFLANLGFKIAVLAIDPSSSRTGGSILGDKTRMTELSRHPNAYIRPSASGSSLGGVTRGSSAAVALCEHAGFDVIIVETVGVGQNETAVEGVVDLFLLLGLPGAGDDLQGIKRGIIELVDLITINKSDINLPLAKQARAHHRSALHLLRPKSPNWVVPVLLCSAKTGEGVPQVWESISLFWTKMHQTGELGEKRKRQRVTWMWKMAMEDIQQKIRQLDGIPQLIHLLEKEVEGGKRNPGQAAQIILKAVFAKREELESK